jgi:hypothetical protein
MKKAVGIIVALLCSHPAIAIQVSADKASPLCVKRGAFVSLEGVLFFEAKTDSGSTVLHPVFFTKNSDRAIAQKATTPLFGGRPLPKFAIEYREISRIQQGESGAPLILVRIISSICPQS